jgi:two-component system nitrogen regulation sensor histidine kinase NtrY
MRPQEGRREDGHADGGAICVAVRQAGADVLISVTDNGVGLPQEDRERLTEPYITHKPKGTGLGLAIVKKVMEDHGGRLLLDDRPDGPGAVATLVLPVKGPTDGALPGETGGRESGGRESVAAVPPEPVFAEKVPDGA